MKFVSLKEAASGGENSRLMLALKTVFNKINPYDVMIFDEIDVGISGNIAFKVSKKIEEISEHARKLMGIEMETYGVYYAAAHSVEPRPKFWASIKSVSVISPFTNLKLSLFSKSLILL